MQSKSLVTYNSEDFSSILKKIEELSKQFNIHLDLSINREHILDEKGSREECQLSFSGNLNNNLKDSFEKFKAEINKLIQDSDHSVKWSVKFIESPKALGLKAEEDANKQLKETHDKMKHHLSGISQPTIRMTSKRTYSSKDGEKFSGNLYIGGDCPEDLKENFMKYYNEVAKPLPEDYKRENQARLTVETPKPKITCSMCQSSLDDQHTYFTNRSGGENANVKICNACVEKEGDLNKMAQNGPIVLVPQKNEIKREKENRHSHEITNIFDDKLFDREFGLVPSWDGFALRSLMKPLDSRFREFERIADRLDRNLRGNFWSPFEHSRFPFDEI